MALNVDFDESINYLQSLIFTGMNILFFVVNISIVVAWFLLTSTGPKHEQGHCAHVINVVLW